MTKYGLIGSSKFKAQMDELAKEIEDKKIGEVVAIPAQRHAHDASFIAPDTLELKHNTYLEYHRNLDKADVALVCNFNDYVGLNSAIDIGFAIKGGKKIEILQQTTIPELLMLKAKVWR